ncbi:Oxaloacetate decarboxylase [Saliniradius amylolyticus]|uniref:Probable oxaloacetate decarboxylase gamma chain n=1 Tax=Saliniradius amylolyticus TaxID=2183582 RepID=A0A2S2E4W0_9ALTE|nr:OadG family protein [Saliniradius amylolyticus]AWL12684.1 Oxaloacetate decarboxylase [Saliniradius amylolyticus]
MNSEVSALLADAGMLMLTGMSVVFIFLVLVIGAIHLIGVVHRLLPATESDEAPAMRSPAQSATTGKPSQAVIAAISAAIHQHRNKS